MHLPVLVVVSDEELAVREVREDCLDDHDGSLLVQLVVNLALRQYSNGSTEPIMTPVTRFTKSKYKIAIREKIT